MNNKPEMQAKLTFMWDCHLFTPIPTKSVFHAAAKLRECFDEDPCGMAFARPPGDSRFGGSYQQGKAPRNLTSDYKAHPGKYFVTDDEIWAWVQQAFGWAELNETVMGLA